MLAYGGPTLSSGEELKRSSTNEKEPVCKPALEAVRACNAMAMSRFCGAADLSGDWVGQVTGPFDSQYTAQYSHVSL